MCQPNIRLHLKFGSKVVAAESPILSPIFKVKVLLKKRLFSPTRVC